MPDDGRSDKGSIRTHHGARTLRRRIKANVVRLISYHGNFRGESYKWILGFSVPNRFKSEVPLCLI